MIVPKDKKNRKLAEWLGYGESPYWAEGTHGRKEWPDFYADEAANALLLEKLLRAGWLLGYMEWPDLLAQFNMTPPKGDDVVDADRKTAICEAALKLMESQ